MYFKLRIDICGSEFEREPRLLSEIAGACLVVRIRVLQLFGIVVLGADGEMAMGMLMNFTTSPKMGTQLQSRGFHNKTELHKKWEEQQSEIVQELHDHGIVWGDVHPMHVVVDEGKNA
jgi:hypothetical protein